ncbi:MAG TPA: VOC family protein [Gemmatimonadales bacterium]|nr:VOC family protein [Gemmatimonadales bacterium]
MPTKRKSPRKPTKRAKRGKRVGSSATRARATRARRQPETLRLRSSSAGYTVNDIDRSVAWYRDVLGCVVVDRWEREGKLMGATLRAGKVDFYLGQDDWRKGRDRQKGEGFRLYCSTAQDVETLAADIKARGGTLLHEPQTEPWGERDFAIADPDGFKITISQSR